MPLKSLEINISVPYFFEESEANLEVRQTTA